MDIVENNKLIAEFMGWVYKEADIYNTKDKVYYTPFKQMIWQEAHSFSYSDYEYESTNEFLIEELLFDTSWDWLMPVVKKCFIGEAEHSEENFNKYIQPIYNGICNIEILDTYKAVTEFIKWYNDTLKNS